MILRRAAYALALLGALLFHITNDNYLGQFLLALCMALPLLSLALSLPGMAGCRLELAAAPAELDLGEELPEIRCEAGAAWVLVEETGREETVRTAYNVPREGEEPIAHGLVLLDGEGLGHLDDLFIGGNG